MTRGPHSNRLPVGILGGMGPEATILLQQRVMAAVTATDDSDHVPLIIDMNPQVPSRIAHLIEGTGEDPSPVLAAMAKRLETAGAQALAMPCNTAHHYAPAVTGAADIPFLSMLDLAAARARRDVGRGGCVGMLASPAVRMTGLFEAVLGAHDIFVLWPEDGDAMLGAIRAIKAEGPVPAARETLAAASAELLAAGARMQFIACSEFSLIAENVVDGAQAVDTVDLLAKAIVDFSAAP